eukprot:3768571-Heterocapsa_arctica.AAC.1
MDVQRGMASRAGPAGRSLFATNALTTPSLEPSGQEDKHVTTSLANGTKLHWSPNGANSE